ncbi:hypothetical protein BH09BAC5_BH09BAC5_06190 [soil metagenome]
MLLCSPAGNDLPFDDSMCEQGRNFSNKIWNAFRLVKGFTVDNSIAQPDSSKVAIEWFNSKFNEQLAIINDLYSKFRLSEALMTTYKLVWDDFCAWYLEMIKPEFVDGKALPIDGKTFSATTEFFEKILKVLHPFMPFITEELYHLLSDRKENDAIIVAKWPEVEPNVNSIVAFFELDQIVISTIRTFRNQKNISPKEKIKIFVLKERNIFDRFFPIIEKLANLEKIEMTEMIPENSFSFLAGTTQYFIPQANLVNPEEEKARLKKELEYNQGFLNSVQKKLANEKFVANAKPELIELERRKQSDAESKIKAIEEQLANL